ncbi:MAG TPA: hypothetical protein DDW50_15765 [Firmicutes bacterium]|jgi:hypothetical protein|nr:hypothetical protein [Bacillota bacterium]
MKLKIKALFILFAILSVCLAYNNILAAEKAPQTAEVYFIHPPEEVDPQIYLFCDNQFLAFLNQGTYYQAEVTPGIHFLWVSDGIRAFLINELEFIPGQTYYLELGGSDYHSLLSPLEGVHLLQRVNSPATFNDNIFIKASGLIDKYYLTNRMKPESSIKITILKVAANEVNSAAEETSLIKVPQFTPIKLAFTELSASNKAKTNDIVTLQVAEDVVSGNQVCVARGTVVKGLFWNVRPARGYGMPGLIDIIIPEVQISPTVRMPVIGRYIVAGNAKVDEARAREASIGNSSANEGIGAILVGTLIASGFAAQVRGKDVIISPGQEVTVWTRDEFWVKPLGHQVPVTTPIPDHTLEDLKAQIPQDVIFPFIAAPETVDQTKSYGLLFSQFNQYKIGNTIPSALYWAYQLAVSKQLQPGELPEIACAKVAHGYYLKVDLNIGAHQIDNGTFELYDPSTMTLLCKVEIKGSITFSPDASAQKIIQKGAGMLLDALRKVQPELIKK